MDKVKRSWELRAPRGDRNPFRFTLRWTRTSCATRQTRTGINVSENCHNALRYIITMCNLGYKRVVQDR